MDDGAGVQISSIRVYGAAEKGLCNVSCPVASRLAAGPASKVGEFHMKKEQGKRKQEFCSRNSNSSSYNSRVGNHYFMDDIYRMRDLDGTPTPVLQGLHRSVGNQRWSTDMKKKAELIVQCRHDNSWKTSREQWHLENGRSRDVQRLSQRSGSWPHDPAES
nr:hypothetical protein CFP56_53350 [Quercus suber]